MKYFVMTICLTLLACGELIEEPFAVPMLNAHTAIFESDAILEVFVFSQEQNINCDQLNHGSYSVAQVGQLLFRMPASVLNGQSFFFSANLPKNEEFTLVARIVEPDGEHRIWQTCKDAVGVQKQKSNRVILQFDEGTDARNN